MAIDALRNIAESAGQLTKARIDLLQNLDLQWKNIFEIIFYPSEITPKSIANSALDTTIASIYTRGIEGISFPSLEYTEINGVKHISGITYPSEVTLTLLEDELGTARNFCQNWLNSIYSPSLPMERVGERGVGIDGFVGTEINNLINTEGHSFYYVFENNQKQSKKNATVILKSKLGIPNLGGWIKLEGLKIKSMEGFEDISHIAGDEPLLIRAVLSIDSAKLITPLGELAQSNFSPL